MTSRASDVTDSEEKPKKEKEVAELPPSGTSLHKRRRGEHPVTLNVKSPQTPSDTESSPWTASPYQWKEEDDPNAFCDGMLQRLKDQTDPASKRGKELATKTKDTIDALDQLEKLLELLDQFLMLKEENNRVLKKLGDINHLRRLHSMRKKVNQENERLKDECKELEMIDEAIDLGLEAEYSQALFESIMAGRSMKRTGSKWRSGPRFGGSLLRRQRSRSAGGDDSDAPPGTPLRRRSEGIFCKEVDKSKVSKWTRVKSAFKWEKALWQPAAVGGVAAVAAGAMVSAVALAGSTPGSASLPNPERDSTSLTPGSALSLSPNSSCEELRMESGICRKSGMYRCDENDNTFLHAPPQDDSSTSPSPNKLHKSPWVKMRDIIQTRRESVKKKTRASKSSPDVVPLRRRSFSDGGDSDAPPALTLTIPSSEELESEPSHPILRKQRSLELGARPPQYRPPRPSKWTKVKRAFLTSASASMPSSPSRHSAFFTDADTEGLSSGCEASGVREEIARNYAALQSRLSREISDRHGKLYAASRSSGLATEDQLSADIRKKWQHLQGGKQTPVLPTRKDLSEDFQRKLDEWTYMKDTNSVPAWERKAKPDEVLVKTSTGLFKFHGISRSFTRKLHEWEKSRGIAPEASTSALLQAARGNKAPPAPLTRAQSDGSVAPSAGGSGRLHASSLSVNDADDFDSEYDRDHCLEGTDECDGDNTRGAVLVEVEAEEVCTAAPLVAMSPCHTPQKPIYTYGEAEARLLCETSSAVTGTAVLQPNGAECRSRLKDQAGAKLKPLRDQPKLDKSSKRKLGRQPSIEEDALFIRKTIEEVERGSSSRLKDDVSEYDNEPDSSDVYKVTASTSKTVTKNNKSKEYNDNIVPLMEQDSQDDFKKKDSNCNNGKKKSKSRARLEREQSKPSESDTEQEVDTVTVEIPRRRKRPRRVSENPKKAQSIAHTESEEDVFVLKLKAPELREGSPEVIVKTTRKIFSPVVRSGESVPRSVIPVDVEDLAIVRPSISQSNVHETKSRKRDKKCEREKQSTRSKSSGDLQEVDDQKSRARPPLPTSPSSQRKPQPKETAPSIRIMIQRYNMKINEEGHTSGASSGASSPAWRSPASERRRPPDMPVGVNIRNNPFLEREVQKSASACQLSRRDQTSSEKRLAATSPPCIDGVPKSHSTNALHPDQIENVDSQETIAASTDTVIPSPNNLPENYYTSSKELSDTVVSTYRLVYEEPSSASLALPEAPSSEDALKLSERAARIKAAREKFLSSPIALRREGTSSASDLRPRDRSSRISCESDVTESQSQGSSGAQDTGLGRSASTGMVNVDREAWQRVTDGGRRKGSRSRFSLARLAAKLRRKDDGAISRLCRQSLLVQLRNKQ